MSRITGVTVALATAAAVLSGSTAGGAEPAAAPPTAELPREITRGVELTLADGDLFQVWTSKDDRTVWSRRRDAAAGAWGSRQVLLREKDLSCGDVDARTSNGAVAVMAQCDPGGYAEDQAPTASRALWSADTVTWSTFELEGEAYEEPGISPDGSRAVWIESNGYLTWGPGGFSRHVLDDRDRAYAVTATIADDEQVSYIYGRHLDESQCGLSVLTRTGDATPSRQDIPLADACQEEVALANVDANTVHYGTLAESGRRVVLSRADSGSPWTVTAIAPSTAPGLLTSGDPTATQYFTAPGLPLHAVSATPRGTFRAQAYDRVAQSWGPPSIVHRTGRRRCTWGDPWTEGPLGVLVVLVRCADRTTVLTTDGSGWAALRMGRHPYGVSPDGRYVAVPGRHRTHVISPELGVVTLPAGVTGRCDIVVPDGPDAAVLLTATGRDRGWPTVLKESGRRGWRLLSRTKLPTPSPACVEATAENIQLPYRFRVHSRYQGYAVRVVERGGRWRVVRSRF